MSNFTKLIAVIPAIVIMTIANVFIGFTVAGVVLLQMMSSGANKYVALLTAIMVALAVNGYIIFNHKLRAYIKNQGVVNDE